MFTHQYGEQAPIWQEPAPSITILSTSINKDSKSKYAAYEISTMSGSRIHRRYSQFVKLESKLKQTRVGGLPALPHKQIWGSFEPNFLDRRRSELQTYLQELILIQGMEENQDLMSFLGMDVVRNSEETADPFMYRTK
jgi:hypothetical protein